MTLAEYAKDVRDRLYGCSVYEQAEFASLVMELADAVCDLARHIEDQRKESRKCTDATESTGCKHSSGAD